MFALVMFAIPTPHHHFPGPNTRRRFRDHQTIPAWVDFNFPVVVVMGTGASPPALTIGGLSSAVLAEYVEGSGTSRLLFEYTVSSAVTSKPSTWDRKGKSFYENSAQGSR